jgi:hypothetical protein
MAIFQTLTTSAKVGLLSQRFNFATGTTQVFKLALYTAAANLGATTTGYTAVGEITGAGYTAGGAVLTLNQNATSEGTTAFVSFADVSWSGALTARGGLVYLADGLTNPSIFVLDFGADKTSLTVFTVDFPPATASTAILRLP